MYTMKDMKTEIQAKVQTLRINRDVVLHPDWITQDVMIDHADITGDDAEFHRVCSRQTVREEVTKQINKIERLDADRSQLSFQIEGFEHLQSHYVIERKSELVGVPIDDASDEELLCKASEYDSMSTALAAHAAEIRRYVKERASGLQKGEAS